MGLPVDRVYSSPGFSVTTVNWQTGVDGGQGVTEQGKRKQAAVKWYGGVLVITMYIDGSRVLPVDSSRM